MKTDIRSTITETGCRFDALRNMALLGDKGMSSSVADHYVHTAEDLVETIESQMASLGFVDETIELAGSTAGPRLVGKGSDVSVIDHTLGKRIPVLAMAHSFVAWVREALRLKSLLLWEVEHSTLEWYVNEVEKDESLLERMKAAPDGKVWTDRDILCGYGADALYDYFAKETACAEYGKFVTSNALRVAADRLNRAIETPCVVEGSGRDTVIRMFTPTVDAAEFTQRLAIAQGTYRNAMSDFNRVRQQLKDSATTASMQAASDAGAEQAARLADREAARRRFEEWKPRRRAEIANMRVFVPKALEPVLDMLKRAESGEDVISPLM